MTWLEPADNNKYTSLVLVLLYIVNAKNEKKCGKFEHQGNWIGIVTFGEIESECGLISSKVVNVENKFFRQVVLAPPDNPTNSSIDKTIFVATNINALHKGKPEVPLKLRVQEWCNKSTTSCINMNLGIPSAEETRGDILNLALDISNV